MKRTKVLAILGAGGFAAEVIESASSAGWSEFRLFDDVPEAQGRKIHGVTCEGSIGDFVRSDLSAYILAIGTNEIRARLDVVLAESQKEAVQIVHATASISRSATLAAGCFIAPFAFVGPNVRIGRHGLVNVGASVGHDSMLADYVQACPGARISGFSIIEQGVFLGSNSVIAPKVKIGEWAKLGASSFANRDVPARAIAIGVPARSAQL